MCSPAEICNVGEYYNFRRLDYDYVTGFLNVIPCVSFAFSFLLDGIGVLHTRLGHMDSMESLKLATFNAWFQVAVTLSHIIVGAVVGISHVVGVLKLADREAPISVNYECRVLHIGLSDWRDFLDIDRNNGMRMARLIFNVGT